MTKTWFSLLLAWIALCAVHGCGMDQRSLGTLATLQMEAGTVPDGLAVMDSQDAPAGEAGPLPEFWVPFGAVSLHPALATAGASQADPTLPADELELYFSTNVVGGAWDIWLCQRASSAAAWGTPSKVVELSSDALDETPEVSADGLTIYLASERPGNGTGEHLWVSHRAKRTDPWAAPVPVTDFVGGDKDLSPTLARDQLTMVFASLHGTDWDLYMTTRLATTAPWGPPAALTELNSTAFDWDPALYRGGNSIVFASRRLGNSNSLFYAMRASASDPFSAPQPATELNVNGDGDPWLSDDGHHIVFDSRRAGGPTKIYEAWR
jgi:hypothetical protein